MPTYDIQSHCLRSPDESRWACSFTGGGGGGVPMAPVRARQPLFFTPQLK
jgi:hypothetical protein